MAELGVAYLILESIPGRDLRFELHRMDVGEQRLLANQLAGYQRKVGSLPHKRGYGYAGVHEDGPSSSWAEVVESQLGSVPSTSEPRLTRLTQAVHTALRTRKRDLAAVAPVGFLDDITTKNVIVQDGALQGLVDFDVVCYGDPLFWIALTAVAIVSDIGEASLMYAEELCRAWGVPPGQQGLLALYTMVHCHRFIAGMTALEEMAWADRMFGYAERHLSIAGL